MTEEDSEHENELIRLSEIIEMLKNDALEVSDLLVKGIAYYKTVSYFIIFLGILSGLIGWVFISGGDLLSKMLYFVLSVFCIPAGIYGFLKYRRLKKKYSELIEIHKSLAEY